ncbi:MAG: hypothetical protein WED59_04250 [Candidatus Woykebacteria bacterium]
MVNTASILQRLVPSNFNKSVGGSESGSHDVREYFGEDALVAALSYMPLASAAIILLRKDNSEFVLYHSKQALILILFIILSFFLIPSIFKLPVVGILMVASITSVYRALSGKKFYIPAVTELARLVEI